MTTPVPMSDHDRHMFFRATRCGTEQNPQGLWSEEDGAPLLRRDRSDFWDPEADLWLFQKGIAWVQSRYGVIEHTWRGNYTAFSTAPNKPLGAMVMALIAKDTPGALGIIAAWPTQNWNQTDRALLLPLEVAIASGNHTMVAALEHAGAAYDTYEGLPLRMAKQLHHLKSPYYRQWANPLLLYDWARKVHTNPAMAMLGLSTWDAPAWDTPFAEVLSDWTHNYTQCSPNDRSQAEAYAYVCDWHTPLNPKGTVQHVAWPQDMPTVLSGTEVDFGCER